MAQAPSLGANKHKRGRLRYLEIFSAPMLARYFWIYYLELLDLVVLRGKYNVSYVVNNFAI